MTVKCTGADFKRFYNDPAFWFKSDSDDEHTWWDDGCVEVNGVEKDDPGECLDTDTVTIHGGVVFGKVFGAKEPSLEAYFKRWKKLQDTTSLVIECPKDKLDAIRAAVKAAGGKVQG